MARARDPNREKAFEIYKEHDGNITNRAIAEMLGVLEKTISAWKSRDKWNQSVECSTTKKKRSTTKEQNSTNDERSLKKKQVIDALVEAGTYSPALDLLIEIYLDAYEEYQENKNEKLRKELAKYLGQLGLDGKNRAIVKSTVKNDQEKTEEPASISNKLVQFRQRKMRT